jgi:uncharacterized membrane protein
MASAIGAYYFIQPIAYVVDAAVLTVIVLVALGKGLNTKDYPWILWVLSLSILWGTSMIGQHIIGNDIHGEFYIASKSLSLGWDIGLRNVNNTSVAVGGLSPLLARIGFPLVWQFKMLYPLLYSVAPILLYSGYKQVFDRRISMLAGLFLIIMPMFTLDLTSMVKGMVAGAFMAALLPLLLAEKLAWWKRLLGVAAAIIGAVMSHYSVGATLTLYLIGTTVIYFGWWLIKRKYSLEAGKTLFFGTSLALVVLFAWYSIAAGGAMLGTFREVAQNMSTAITSMATKPPVLSLGETTPKGTDQQETYTYKSRSVATQADYDYRTQPTDVTGTYLDKQEQVIRTALGIDFMNTSLLGKVFRVVQFFTQIAIVVGAFIIVFRRKEIQRLYKVLIITGAVVLGALLFVPYVATITSTTRFYWMMLLFISPALPTGLDFMFRKRWAAALVLVVYALFTLGIVFEASYQTDLTKVNMPYSLALSNARLNINGAFTKDDLTATKWLTEKCNSYPNTMIRSDYNGLDLVMESVGSNYTRLEPSVSYYLLVTTWSEQHQTVVYAKTPGLRYYEPLVIPANAVEAASFGDAKIYYVEKK